MFGCDQIFSQRTDLQCVSSLTYHTTGVLNAIFRHDLNKLLSY